MQEVTMRVVVIGDTNVGKTALIYKYTRDQFESDLHNTITIQNYNRELKVGNTTIIVNIIDTAGQERYRSLGSIYYRNAQAAIIVFDLTNQDTYNNIQDWVNDFKENAFECDFMVFAANKCDLEDKIVVSTDDCIELAEKHNCECIMTSALDGTGVNELFDVVNEHLKQLVRSNTPEVSPSANIAHEPAQSSSCC